MRIVRIDKFTEEPTTVSWIVTDLLPNVGWTLFVGTQGIGKSTFAIQLCDALQNGSEFMGKATEQTSVLFIQADSQPEEWKEMLRRIVPNSHGWTMVDVPVKSLDNPSYVEAIGNLIAKINPGFIVFDSLYNLTGKSINTEGALVPIQVMKSLAGLVPWLLIHHPPQGENRAAGHHSISANCSNVWILLKTKLKIEKCRLSGIKEVAMSRSSEGLWQARDQPRLVETYPELKAVLT